MQIVYDFGGETPDGVNRYLRFEEFSEKSNTQVLMYGYDCTTNKALQTQYSFYERKVLLDLWSPCAMFNKNKYGENHFQQLEYFDEVYSICPYTVEWTNKQLGYDLMEYVFYPIGIHVEPENQNKEYDVAFFGGVHSKEHQESIDIISKFNYCFTSLENHPKATHIGLPNLEKMKKVAQSKIGVCYNLLYPKTDLHFPYVKEYDRWQENRAFSRITEEVCPQFKSRIHECALSKTLILCRKDDWNLIEDWYRPGEDFVYFDGNEELEDKIREILNNWENYSNIVENAYNKVVNNYTTKHLVNLIRGN